MGGQTLFDKVWAEHVIADLGDDTALLHVDRLLMHDLSGLRGLKDLEERNLPVRNPELCFGVPDHAISTAPGRRDDSIEISARLVPPMRKLFAEYGIRFFDLGEEGQGIVHVIGPEQGIVLPGLLLVCGDSHTCTQGAVGALSFGIGSTELTHVLATQTLEQKKPKRQRVRFEGRMQKGVTPKDLILHLIGQISAAGGDGYAMEYAGSAIRSLDMEGRLTVCNLSIELGAKVGMVAPDDTTIDYFADRPYAPKGALWEQAVAHWRTLPSDEDAVFDAEVSVDVDAIEPQITWGTSPMDVINVGAAVPDPASAGDASRQAAMAGALDYMGLEPGRPIAGTPVDRVFIGSCTNSRLSDLESAAAIASGRKVADGVTAWVVPGSELVKRAAEAKGLDKVFLAAGFEWREPGCSSCVAANGEIVGPQQRCVSTSNRNFQGRQGPGARTHLASPAMAAAAAVTGAITDVRRLMA